MATCNEVQFVQTETQHHGAKWHKRATCIYGHIRSQKQSYYKTELRCHFTYEMHRAHVRGFSKRQLKLQAM